MEATTAVCKVCGTPLTSEEHQLCRECKGDRKRSKAWRYKLNKKVLALQPQW